MKNHPDVVLSNQERKLTEEEASKIKKRAVKKFMEAKGAFDAIVQVDGGGCVLRSELESDEESMNSEEFDAWFHEETGHVNDFQFDIDPAVMRECAEMVDKVGGELGRDGGMWELARLVSGRVKEGKDVEGVLRLEAGEIKPGEENNSVYKDGSLRRRRRQGSSTGRRRR